MFTRFYEGASYDKCVEITAYGGAGAAVDAADLELWGYINGDTDSTPKYKLALSDVLNGQSLDVLVLCNSRTKRDAKITDEEWLAMGIAFPSGSVLNFNGNDQLQLVKVGDDVTILDVLGGDSGKTNAIAGPNQCAVRKPNTVPCTSIDAAWCNDNAWSVLYELKEDPNRKCDMLQKRCDTCS